jgi:hypothetical protein
VQDGFRRKHLSLPQHPVSWSRGFAGFRACCWR